jgi:hypothetical protein
MSNEQVSEVQVMPFWKASLISFAVLAILIIWIIFGQLVLKLNNPWVGLVALTTFGAAYRNNLADAPKIWIGSAVALLIAWLLWSIPAVIGPIGQLVGLILIVLCLGAFISQRFSLVCNSGMFMMLSVSTGAAQIMKEQQHLSYLLDLAYGAVCFWIIPLAIVKLKEMKASKKLTNEISTN